MNGQRLGSGPRGKVALVTGGAGFIGSNLSRRLLGDGFEVRIFDNLSRPSVENNLEWLKGSAEPRLEVVAKDIRDEAAVRAAARDADVVYHLAAQVAVTRSLEDPRMDFEVNAGGTLNLLEALRARLRPPALVFTSTNKVYGSLDDVRLERDDTRYRPAGRGPSPRGVTEDRPLAFRSPYGCSKGAADQYVLDYARSFRLPATVLRMSCIYGPRQFGTEEQGWVAHFFREAARGAPLAVYGDGCQVRDLLYVDDAVEAFVRAAAGVDRVAGRPFNLGGGPRQSASLREVLERLSTLLGRPPEVHHEPWRTGDQRWYVSDCRRLREALGWMPRVALDEGFQRLFAWTQERLELEPDAAPAATGVGS